MPFVIDEVRWDLACGRGDDGHWWGRFGVFVDARALVALGLHPEQAFAVAGDASPPHWWHAAGERYAVSRWPLARLGAPSS
ncbi:hypothetical protein ACGFZQ_19155 [Streptomyces sp. NPDC048254]|uniref:hypothetical protein n=1 Tax=Streptomyces sp. NPDC048254 TaxID=3365525 RepID=UPI00371D1763